MTRPLAALACLALLAGCGGGDEASEPSAPAPSADTRSQDAEARSLAREAVTELEACFVDTQSYADCKPSSDAVEVEKASAARYVVTARSESGATFSVEKTASGELSKTCAPADADGCSPDGIW